MELSDDAPAAAAASELAAECQLASLQYLRELGKEPSEWLPLEVFSGPPPECFDVFRGAEGCYARAGGVVGLTSVPCAHCHTDHVVAIYPKGAPSPADADGRGAWAALNRFLDLILISAGYDPRERPAVELGGARGPTRFLVLFALGFTRALDELCRRDFRLYYRREEAERAAVRGRVDLVRHSINAVRGRGTRIPCRWEEFTTDHLDNRLLAMARDAAVGVLRQFPSLLRNEWLPRHSASALHFAEVDRTAVTSADFPRARLRRLSPLYRESLDWAEWLVRGVRARQLGQGGRWAPSLLFDSAKLFESFVRRIVRETAMDLGRACTSPARGLLLEHPVMGCAPDAVIEGAADAPPVIVDAKYKLGIEDDASDSVRFEYDGFRASISAPDLYQIYYYLRAWQSPLGVIAMPFWDERRAAALILTGAIYAKSPLDHTGAKVVVLGLNLQRPPQQVLGEARTRLARHIRGGAEPARRDPPNDHGTSTVSASSR